MITHVVVSKSIISDNNKHYSCFMDLPSDIDLDGSRSVGVLLLWLHPQATETFVAELVEWLLKCCLRTLVKRLYLHRCSYYL